MNAAVIAVFAMLVVAASSQQFQQPQQVQRTVVPILNHQETRDAHNQYSYSYQTGDGASFTDHGALKQVPEGYVLVRQGSHAYTAPDGRVIKLQYTADENGYHPTGDHLPVAPAPIV